jgi:MoaA/NifB/PqqE/SkfB family radical SAM enzyme
LTQRLSILYRGLLKSCNYGCPYCPFAKHLESPEELHADWDALNRFTRWVERANTLQLSIFFTPWGEALIRKWYRQAIGVLSHLPHVHKVAIQTNLSCPLEWLADVESEKLGVWATYHPGEVSRENFLAQCRRLLDAGVRFSVGVVGLKEHEEEIRKLRKELPPATYLWINAYKSQPDYYTQELLDTFASIDPLFSVNNQYHFSGGHPCHAGHNVISVDGEGVVRRCHFIRTPIGNLYESRLLDLLSPVPSACTNGVCGCHIGYVHMPHLRLDSIFGEGLLERIPVRVTSLSTDDSHPHHQSRQSTRPLSGRCESSAARE